MAAIVLASLSLSLPAAAQSDTSDPSFSYATDCVSNIDNKTVVLPANMSSGLPSGDDIAVGDTLAAYTDDGICAGFEVWTENSSAVAMAVAGPNAADDTGNGFSVGEVLKFEVYDVSAGTTVDLGAEIRFRDCSGVGLATCRDDGTYANGSIAVLDALMGGPLPVELSDFNVERSGARAVLRWSTASEQNNAGFNVQHRRSGQSSWTTMTFVKGAGTTAEAQSYTFETDDLDVGTHEFRLQQVDQDGSSSLSTVVSVERTVDGAFELSGVYPNPVRSSASIDLAVREKQNIKIELYDLLGRRVATVADRDLPSNKTLTFSIGASRLASGSYFLRVRGNEFSETRRVIVVR